jgi:hypothetical protein
MLLRRITVYPESSFFAIGVVLCADGKALCEANIWMLEKYRKMDHTGTIGKNARQNRCNYNASRLK